MTVEDSRTFPTMSPTNLSEMTACPLLPSRNIPSPVSNRCFLIHAQTLLDTQHIPFRPPEDSRPHTRQSFRAQILAISPTLSDRSNFKDPTNAELYILDKGIITLPKACTQFTNRRRVSGLR